MSQECIVAVYKSIDEARHAVQVLDEAKYPPDQVSLVADKAHEAALHDTALRFGDMSETNALKGAGVGGLVGALFGAPLVAASGAGIVLAAGPIGLALAGGVVGGLVGAMSGWGVHDDHVRRYEQMVADGDVLVIVHGDPKQIVLAEEIILSDTKPSETHLHAENSADSVDP